MSDTVRADGSSRKTPTLDAPGTDPTSRAMFVSVPEADQLSETNRPFLLALRAVGADGALWQRA